MSNPGWNPLKTACIALAAILPTACNSTLQHGLEEGSANQIVTTLEKSGISASKVVDPASDPPSFTIEVASSEVTSALDILRAQGLPREDHGSFGKVYGKPSLIPTRTEEQARFLEAMTGELERTLEIIDGVVDARVHLVLEQRDPLAANETPQIAASAAVLMKVHTGAAPIAIADVRTLVAGSVAGLLPERVSVVLTATPGTTTQTGGVVSLGPLWVAPSSRTILLAAFAVGTGLLALLSVLLLVTTRRLATRPQQPVTIE
jgi:type III secretion protein J